MLRIIQNAHSSGAKSYYSSSDYYLEGQELAGQWRGEGARRLGLMGEVAKNDWDSLCDNLDPKTGGQLTASLKSNRTVGYDFNFHVPKSVSALYAMTRDERLLDAFRDSVDETMQVMEAEMRTRVRKAGQNEDRQTGNMVWGEFVHFTSRPVDGVPDPHLHAHCFVFNATWDGKESGWKAGQFRDLKRDAPYFEAMFHSHLARNLAELGLPIERTKQAWEIKDVPQSVIEKFSRRRSLIEEKAKELGIESAEAKAELGSKTREKKTKELTMSELQAQWRERLTAPEGAALDRLAERIGGDAQPADEGAAKRAMEFAIDHVFERQSVAPERALLTEALRQSVGQATALQVHRQVDAQQVLISERNGRRMATTRSVLAEERRIIDFARNGRGTCKALGLKGAAISEKLNARQQSAVRHVLGSRDRVMMIRGAAGVGKTTLMREAARAVEANGTKVLAFAPSAEASRGVLHGEGFTGAETVSRLLLDEKLQRQAQGQLIWVDEAGLLGTRTMARLFDLADKLDARVLLTGDRRQHGSVERGAALRILEEEAGIKPADVKEIQRQKDQYKSAIKALSEGHVREGFNRLDDLGWIREVPDVDRYRQLAGDYVDAVTHGQSALVVSPTHAEGDRITASIRQSLKELGRVGAADRKLSVLRNANLTEAQRRDPLCYRSGDVLQFHQNAKGYTRGDRIVASGKPLPFDQATRFGVFHTSELVLAPGDMVRVTQNGQTLDGKHRLNNGSLFQIKAFDPAGNLVLDNGWTIASDYGHLDYGYVVTSHSSQGKTVDRVFVGQSSESFAASSREQFYVSCSRGRHSVTIYCDDKESLREAVERGEERVTATELVSGLKTRDIVALQSRYAEPSQQLDPKSKDREELVYER